MDWTRERIDFLQMKWQSGESTASIGRSCTDAFHEPVSKNSIVGKAHRMGRSEPGWDSRPSPIKPPKPEAAVPAAGQHTLPPLPSQRPAPKASRSCVNVLPTQRSVCGAADKFLAFRVLPAAAHPRQPPPPPPSPPAPAPRPIYPGPRCEARDPTKPLLRRDGTGCLFPIGNPKDHNFRYCGDGLDCLSKPYCKEHMKLTIVPKPRRRGEDVTPVRPYYDED